MSSQSDAHSGTKNSKADFIDHHVSKKLRFRRIMLGLSQQCLAEKVSVSVQQIQKYEKGDNRIASGRLYQLATLLNVSVNYFFDEVDSKGSPVLEEDKDKETYEKEVLVLVRAYKAIKDDNVRRKVVELVKSITSE